MAYVEGCETELMVMKIQTPLGRMCKADEAAALFKQALLAITELAETRIAVMRLARAIQKTMRRVNALEKILMPDAEEKIRFIQDALDESDHQTLFTLKLVKKRLEARET